MSTARDPNLPTGNQGAVIVRHEAGYAPIEYRLIRQIGDGNFGVVWKANKEGVDVALKILKGSASSEDTVREIKSLEALEGLQHEYLLQTHGYWIDGDRLIIELELADGGCLKQRLKQCKRAGKPGVPAGELLKYFGEAAQALDYLHTRKPQFFLHRDIKPGNILLVKGCAKLADFGLLRQVASDKSQTHTTGGTQPYMSPESIVSNSTSPRTDLFSLAVSYVQLRQGHLPFPGDQPFTIMKKIVDDPPELNDQIFGPAEKAVLCKALEKRPSLRHHSCGEFVAELIAAVPPSEAIYVPPEPPAASTGLNPLEIDTNEFTAIGTARPGSSRKKTDPQFRPGDSNPSAKPLSDTSPTDPKSSKSAKSHGSTKRTRKSAGKRNLFRVLVLALIVGAVAGLWFLLNANTKDKVRQLVSTKEYSQALESIQQANPFLLPFPHDLEREVEQAWWNDLDPKNAANKESLQQKRDELDRFEKAFKSYPGIKERRTEIALALVNPNTTKIKTGDLTRSSDVIAAVDQLLTRESLDDARKLIAEQEKLLSPADKQAAEDRLAQKQAIHDLFKKAKGRIESNQFEDALADLDSAKLRFDFSSDKKLWEELFTAAKNHVHARLVNRAETALKKGEQQPLALAKEKLAAYRNRYPDDAWSPGLEKYQLVAKANDVAERAWIAFQENRLTATQKELDTLTRDFEEDPLALTNVRLLTAFLKAHQPGDSPSRLIDAIVAEKDKLDGLGANIWKALAKVDSGKNRLGVENLAALKDSVPALSLDEKKSRSKLFANVLTRLLSEGTSWRPNDKLWSTCAALCKLIIPADENDWIRSLHMESLMMDSTATADAKDILLSLDEPKMWYAAYASALVWKKADPRKAANLLTAALKDKPAVLKPPERAKEAVKVLRTAVKSLKPGSERGFKELTDAEMAKPWLVLLVAFQKDEQKKNDEAYLDDLLDLAGAASRTRDGSALTSAVDRAVKHLKDSSLGAEKKEASYYWLGKDYQDLAASEEKAFDYFDEALKIRPQDKDSAWRKSAAQDGAEYALTLGQLRKTDRQKADSVITLSGKTKYFAAKLKPLKFERAADLNRDAFALLLEATAKKTATADKKIGELGKAFLAELPDEIEAYHVPVVTHKLKYLRAVNFFDEKNDHVRKSTINPFFEKTMAEARRAHGIKQPASAIKVDSDWWDGTRAALLRELYDSQFGYADVGFKMIDEEPGEFNKTHVPILEGVLKNYLEIRRLFPELLEPKKGHLALKIGYTYVNLGHSQKDDADKSLQNYREGFQELKQISAQFRDKMPEKERSELRKVEDNLKERLDKSK